MKRHFRIAALQCNFQTPEQTLGMPDFWADMGFNAEQLLHTHADMYSAVYEEARHGKMMEAYLRRSKARGISTIIYMNCHVLGPSIEGLKEEWAIRNEDGTYPLFYGTYPGCCLNSSWVDYFYRCLEELAKFEISGVFFDGPLYEKCACPCCRAKFENEFDKLFETGTKEDFDRFVFESVITFKNNLYAKIKSINPAWLMYFNEGLFAGHSNSANFARQLESNDIVGTEGGFFFYSEPKNYSYWHCSCCAKLAEAVANGRPTVIFFAGDHKPWGWFMHTPAETKLCYASAIGNGASVWYGIHCNPDNLRTVTGQTAREMVQFDKKYDELYQNTKSLAEIAVFYSYDTAASYSRSGKVSDLYGDAGNSGDFLGDYCSAYNGAFGILEHLNCPYDIVTDLNLHDLARYKICLLPSLAMVSDKVQQALGDYIRNGGVIIADGELGCYDENGVKRDSGAFEALAGYKLTGQVSDNKTFNYFDVKRDIYVPDNGFNWMPITPWSLEMIADGAEVIGKASPALPGCYSAKPELPQNPYITRKPFGKGVFYYIAGGYFEFYFNFTHVCYRELMDSLFRRHAAFDFDLRNASVGTALSIRETTGGVLAHLTNFVSAVHPINKSAVQYNLSLKVPEKFKSAVALTVGKELERDEKGCFILPLLEEFEVIYLKP